MPPPPESKAGLSLKSCSIWITVSCNVLLLLRLRSGYRTLMTRYRRVAYLRFILVTDEDQLQNRRKFPGCDQLRKVAHANFI